MRWSRVILSVVISVAACAHYVETTSSAIAHWEGRDIADLIAALGPFDTTSIRGDSRSYDWSRFGNCHVTARTALDGKIVKLEAEGTAQGCRHYLQKLGAG